MMDDRRLREITPSQRGYRFQGRWRGRLLRANVPYLVVTSAAVTRHWTAAGARNRVRILRQYGIEAWALRWDSDRWAVEVTSADVTRRRRSVASVASCSTLGRKEPSAAHGRASK